jgi:Fe-S cluster assembly protein SufD
MSLKDKLISSFKSLEKNPNPELQALKESELRNFEDFGFPSKKEEAWKYTSLKSILKADYSLFPNGENSVSKEDLKPYLMDSIASHQLVFIDGNFSAEFSTPFQEDYQVLQLSEAFKDEACKTIIEQHFNKVTPENNGLNSLNTAFSREGAFIHIPKNKVTEKPIQLLYISTGSEAAVMTQPRNLIVVGENAQAKIMERHQSLTENQVLTNSVTEIFLEKRAMLDYYKIQNDRRDASLIDNTYVEQHDDSVASVHTFSFGGKLTRNNLNFYQKGEHINSIMKGVTVIEDKQHVDHNTLVHHQQPNCESHQDYKSIFDGKSTGVFNGKVLVDKIAQKIFAYQSNNNVLVSDRATINSKPQLEIFADDVECSHGCTVGQLDDEALYYFKTRGIPDKEARALLMYAFANTVLNSVKIPELSQRINGLIAKKLNVDLGYDRD